MQGGLHSGLVATIVLVVLVLLSPKILQKGKPSEEGTNSQIPAGAAQPDIVDSQTGSEEPKVTTQPSSIKSSTRSPDGVAADCPESAPSLEQTGMDQPDQSVHKPAINVDAFSPDRQAPLSLSSIELQEGQQDAPQKDDEAKTEAAPIRPDPAIIEDEESGTDEWRMFLCSLGKIQQGGIQ